MKIWKAHLQKLTAGMENKKLSIRAKLLNLLKVVISKVKK